ncbi:HEPN domain-containing protein [Ktedonobacter racemifer]|uniref:Uncharacterized protein n=1 Tax=Ktedonobacter racemifer DSM 44963 TaxID=485913 RepID=D6U371_KTERA|nr:HEPN domain-containing protein [Ktedonobacter racemifer]EFH81075.1 conserved hypothetical protein [Ktedonobacter racemifer DSM 44963]
MSKKDIFVIFPYLKTTNRVLLRGIVFRSSEDLEGLSLEQQKHLKTLFAMFFLRNNLRIKRMVYACVELEEHDNINQNLQQRLYEAQILINYRYASGDLVLHQEHASMYTLTTTKIPQSSIWPEDHPQIDHNVENMTPEDVSSNKYIDGYDGMLNGRSIFWVVPGNRTYPPVPHLSLNISQDLWFDIGVFAEAERNWAWVDFLKGYKRENTELENRLFTAMDWYNRGTVTDTNEPEMLLNLAVAFESLFSLESTDKVTARFEETVMTLLGSFPRLDSWLKQFYDARSSVVHKGMTQHYLFYTKDREKTRFPSGYGEKDTAELTYGSLTSSGRRIFRLCLTTMLSGAKMAEDDRLSSLFVHNQERLSKILRLLNQKTQLPEQRLHSIAEVVNDLHDHHPWSSEDRILSETLVAVGNSVIQTYLATKPQLSEQAETLVQEVLQQLQRKDISADEKLDFFERIAPTLSQGLSNPAANQPSQGKQYPLATVLYLLSYVASPHFLTRKWMRPQNGSQGPSS